MDLARRLRHIVRGERQELVAKWMVVHRRSRCARVGLSILLRRNGIDMATLDWTKPIEFENGEPCELIETCLEGFGQFPDCTRVIRRIGVDGITNTWFVREDGKTHWPGYNVINKIPA
jgi:hypothetical protein